MHWSAPTTRRAEFLLDTFDPRAKGGIGRAFDWSLWPKKATKPLVLAGGLTPGQRVRCD